MHTASRTAAAMERVRILDIYCAFAPSAFASSSSSLSQSRFANVTMSMSSSIWRSEWASQDHTRGRRKRKVGASCHLVRSRPVGVWPYGQATVHGERKQTCVCVRTLNLRRWTWPLRASFSFCSRATSARSTSVSAAAVGAGPLSTVVEGFGGGGGGLSSENLTGEGGAAVGRDDATCFCGASRLLDDVP